MKKIAIIPARSGSKGLPNKNILNLCGKPLIAWSIEAAQSSKCFEHIYVSTDSKEYGTIAEQYGAEVIYRSKEAASDTASTYDAIMDLFKNIEYEDIDYFVLLQPTSPLRDEKNIIEAIELFEKNFNNKNTLVSVKEAEKASALIKKIDKDLSLKNFDIDFSNYSRQKYKEYEPNGAIFISKIDYYIKKKHFFGDTGIAYIMSKEKSVDIDDAIDFELAITLKNKCLRGGKLYESIISRISEKKSIFLSNNIDKNTITFIGHSQLDNWPTNEIGGLSIVNLGIRGISSFQYNELICNKNLINYNSDIYLVMHGTNDIVYNYSIDEICQSIKKNINYIKKANQTAKILFVQCLNVNGRIDRNNLAINELNHKLKKELENLVYWIDTYQLNDEYGNLNIKYTNDGLHLNLLGYEILQNLIENKLRNIIK